MDDKESMLVIDFSIIIPLARIEGYIFETCRKISEMECDNFEIIVFPDICPDDDIKRLEKELGARIVPTGCVCPGNKRDMAITYARGKYLAFIDDDAYPDKNWLKAAKKYLEYDNVSAVGGTQLTPAEDSFWQRVSGAMFSSILSGGAIIRYSRGYKIRQLFDWPTVNFIIKKADFIQIGGFDTHYWPGEDTKLCLDITKKLGKKILYIPDMLVYHHRRAGLGSHLNQAGGYGRQRGHFFRVFPETSRKLSHLYFMPALFVIFLTGGLIGSFFSFFVLQLFLLGLTVYFSAVIISTIILIFKTKEILVSFALIPYLILFHIWYGLRFIQGFLFTKELKSKSKQL